MQRQKQKASYCRCSELEHAIALPNLYTEPGKKSPDTTGALDLHVIALTEPPTEATYSAKDKPHRTGALK
jgi:hypothetical protein